jgi:hypothetical protein
MRSVQYRSKVGEYSFPELLVVLKKGRLAKMDAVLSSSLQLSLMSPSLEPSGQDLVTAILSSLGSTRVPPESGNSALLE